MTHAGESLARLRLLLTGDAAARPDGLERALTRAGFSIGEAPSGAAELPPDAILTTLPDANFDRLGAKRVLLTHMGEAMLAKRGEVDSSRYLLAEDGMTLDL